MRRYPRHDSPRASSRGFPVIDGSCAGTSLRSTTAGCPSTQATHRYRRTGTAFAFDPRRCTADVLRTDSASDGTVRSPSGPATCRHPTSLQPCTPGRSEQRDYSDLDSILAKYPHAERDALIPLLQDVQRRHGYLSRDAVVRIGQHLGLPASKIYGVATFYNQFRFQPQGKYHVQVCRGTACHVRGSGCVLDAIRRELKIEPGQTSRDGTFSLEVVACIGACGLAPVICVNDSSTPA